MIGVDFVRLREHASVELTYGVAASRRNRGVATAAVLLVTGCCLHELWLDEVPGLDELSSY